MDGMGEVIKYGCIRDAALFETLKERGSFENLQDILPEIIFRRINSKRQGCGKRSVRYRGWML